MDDKIHSEHCTKMKATSQLTVSINSIGRLGISSGSPPRFYRAEWLRKPDFKICTLSECDCNTSDVSRFLP
jgi:hypothetical protein